MSGDTPEVIDVPDSPNADDGAVVERRVKMAMVPVTAVQAERAEKAKAKAEAEELRKRLADLEPDAARWRDHSAAELQRLNERNAADLAALPETARAPIAAITDPVGQRALLDAIRAATATQSTTTTPPPPFPVGGASQQAPVGGVELTPAERAWVESDAMHLRGIDPAIIKRHYARAHPGAPK